MTHATGTLMALGKGYWSIVEPIWDVINIDDPEVFLTTFSHVQREAGLVYAAYFCQSEVCNGGFDQFFSNSTGVLAPEALEGFTAIGQLQIGSLLAQAMKLIGSPYIRERGSRQAALDLVDTKSFEELDERFFALIGTEAGGFEIAADSYVARIAT